MAAFNFPNSPSTNDTHTENGVTFKWNGTVWKRQNASYTDATNLNISGISTFGGVSTFTGDATFSGNVAIGKTLTYEDVKNVDSVGVITARSGINVTGNILGTQDQTFIGANTSDGSDNKSVMLGGGGSTSVNRGAYVWVKGNEYSGAGGELILSGGAVSSALIDFYTNSGQRARITSTGELNIGGSYTQTTNKLNVTGTAYVSSDITAGDDIIAADEIRNNVPGDFWATDNTFISINGYGNLTHQGGYQTVLTSNGYRTSTSAQWKSYAANSTTGAAQIRLDPTGYISFGTESNKSNGSTWVVTERLRIASDGDLTLTGADNVEMKMKCGTSSGNNILAFLNSGGTTRGNITYDSDNNFLLFNVNQGERLRIASDGKVGIGIAAPDSLLHIHDGSAGSIAASSLANLTIESSASDYNVLQFLSPATASQQIRFGDPSDNGAGWIQYSHSSNALQFGTNGPEKLRIDSSGRLLLGTTTEGYADADDLTIATSGHTGITIRSGTSSLGTIAFSDATSGASEYTGYIQYNHNNNSLSFGTGTSLRLTITSDGNVKIGDATTDYTYKLTVSGNATTNTGLFMHDGSAGTWFGIQTQGANGLVILRADARSGAYPPLTFNVGNSEKLRIASDGDVLIGTTTSAGKLTVDSGTSNTCATFQSSDSGAGINVKDNHARSSIEQNGVSLKISSDTGAEYANSDIRLQVDGSTKAKINGTLGVRAENTCKAWLSYQSEPGSEGIVDDFYVSSVSDEATGTFYVNLDADIGTEDGVAYIFGSHNDGARPLQAVIGYTPSHGSYNPWWSMEDEGTRVNLMRADNNTKVDGEWFCMVAFADAI